MMHIGVLISPQKFHMCPSLSTHHPEQMYRRVLASHHPTNTHPVRFTLPLPLSHYL